MSTETFTFTDASQFKKFKSFMSEKFSEFKTAVDKAEELDEDSINNMIENFFMNYDEDYKVSKANKSTKGEGKSRKSRTVKDENKPKRAQSAYMLWLNDNREKIKTEHFTDGDGNLTLEGRDKVTKVAKKAGELWKTLSDEDRSPYETQAKELKEQYQRDKEAYESSSSPPPPLESNGSDSEEVSSNSKGKTTAKKKSPKKKLTAEKVPVKNSKKNASGNKKSTGKSSTKNASTKKKVNTSDSEDDAGPAPSSKAVKFEKHGSESESSDSDSD